MGEKNKEEVLEGSMRKTPLISVRNLDGSGETKGETRE